MIQGDLFKDKFTVEIDLFTGEEVARQIAQKRTSFIGFFLTEQEKQSLLVDSHIENVSLSEFIRVQLGFKK